MLSEAALLNRFAELMDELQGLPRDERVRTVDEWAASGAEEPRVIALLRVEVSAPPLWDRDRTEEVVAERYRIQGKLGEGRFGLVYRARDERTAKRVALKLIRGASLEPDTLAAVQSVEVQGVVRLTDLGKFTDESGEECTFLVTDLVEGNTITEAAREARMDPAQRLQLFQATLEIVARLHKRLIAHLDLKPGNILYRTCDASVCIIDFGLADILSSRGLPAAGGTPPYMAPEQATGGALERDGALRADVYALGVLLLELLSGKRPESGADAQARLVDASRVVAASGLDAPDDLSRILQCALAPVPKERYANARDFLTALHTYVSPLHDTGPHTLCYPFHIGELPPQLSAPRYFVGRQAEIQQVLQGLGQSDVVVAWISGRRDAGVQALLAHLLKTYGADIYDAMQARVQPRKFGRLYLRLPDHQDDLAAVLRVALGVRARHWYALEDDADDEVDSESMFEEATTPQERSGEEITRLLYVLSYRVQGDPVLTVATLTAAACQDAGYWKLLKRLFKSLAQAGGAVLAGLLADDGGNARALITTTRRDALVVPLGPLGVDDARALLADELPLGADVDGALRAVLSLTDETEDGERFFLPGVLRQAARLFAGERAFCISLENAWLEAAFPRHDEVLIQISAGALETLQCMSLLPGHGLSDRTLSAAELEIPPWSLLEENRFVAESDGSRRLTAVAASRIRGRLRVAQPSPGGISHTVVAGFSRLLDAAAADARSEGQAEAFAAAVRHAADVLRIEFPAAEAVHEVLARAAGAVAPSLRPVPPPHLGLRALDTAIEELRRAGLTPGTDVLEPARRAARLLVERERLPPRQLRALDALLFRLARPFRNVNDLLGVRQEVLASPSFQQAESDADDVEVRIGAASWLLNIATLARRAREAGLAREMAARADVVVMGIAEGVPAGFEFAATWLAYRNSVLGAILADPEERRGRLDEIARRAEEGLRMSAGDPWWLLAYCRAVLRRIGEARTDETRGDLLGEAEAAIQRVYGHAAEGWPLFARACWAALLRSTARRDVDPDVALRRLDDALRLLDRAPRDPDSRLPVDVEEALLYVDGRPALVLARIHRARARALEYLERRSGATSARDTALGITDVVLRHAPSVPAWQLHLLLQSEIHDSDRDLGWLDLEAVGKMPDLTGRFARALKECRRWLNNLDPNTRGPGESTLRLEVEQHRWRAEGTLISRARHIHTKQTRESADTLSRERKLALVRLVYGERRDVLDHIDQHYGPSIPVAIARARLESQYDRLHGILRPNETPREEARAELARVKERWPRVALVDLSIARHRRYVWDFAGAVSHYEAYLAFTLDMDERVTATAEYVECLLKAARFAAPLEVPDGPPRPASALIARAESHLHSIRDLRAVAPETASLQDLLRVERGEEPEGGWAKVDTTFDQVIGGFRTHPTALVLHLNWVKSARPSPADLPHSTADLLLAAPYSPRELRWFAALLLRRAELAREGDIRDLYWRAFVTSDACARLEKQFERHPRATTSYAQALCVYEAASLFSTANPFAIEELARLGYRKPPASWLDVALRRAASATDMSVGQFRALAEALKERIVALQRALCHP